MDERLKDIVENLNSMKIGLDETFKFHCMMCGKCCIHREDILLSPRDIYNMSKELGIKPEDLFERYCEVYIGPDSKVPIVRLKPRGSVKRCPLLKNRKCMVHKSKPTVCAMYPLGRCIVAANPKEGLKDISQGKFQYIFSDPGCGNASETHTVREYLEAFGIPVEDNFFLKWQQAILDMGNFFRKIEKTVSNETMELVWMAAFTGIYLHYDIGQEFMAQFEDNVKNFFDMLYSTFTEGGGSPTI